MNIGLSEIQSYAERPFHVAFINNMRPKMTFLTLMHLSGICDFVTSSIQLSHHLSITIISGKYIWNLALDRVIILLIQGVRLYLDNYRSLYTNTAATW